MRVAMLAWGTTLIFAGDLAPLQLSTIEISIFCFEIVFDLTGRPSSVKNPDFLR